MSIAKKRKKIKKTIDKLKFIIYIMNSKTNTQQRSENYEKNMDRRRNKKFNTIK